ncbi:GHMP family kinase ATP-binding protein [Peptostreptococcus stomatis]
MKKGYGTCPATCGELVQGYSNKRECISSYCIDVFSRAIITEGTGMSNRYVKNKRKSFEAISMVLDHFDIDRSCLDKLSLSIRSSIPTGKGMASSTADIGASIMAILDYLDQDMDSDLISKIVARVEPTDSIYNENICIFDPLKGQIVDDLGKLSVKKVLILEPGFKINTVKLRMRKDYYKCLSDNRVLTSQAFKKLKYGIENDHMESIRQACETSALANENIKITPYLRDLIEIARACDYSFLNISHTGSTVGIGLNAKTDLDRLEYEIRNSEISKVYKKQYIKNIIDGGLRRR